MPGGPAKEPVEHVSGAARLAGVEPVQMVNRVMQTAGQVKEQAHRAVLEFGEQYEFRRPAGPRLPAPATQPQRAQRQMLHRLRRDRMPQDAALLLGRLMRFVRNFGLHQPDRTPCGQPLPVSEAHAMAEIAREGQLRQVELARRLRLEKSSVSRLVTNLVNRGWLHRHPATDDGRGVLLELTDAGVIAAARQAEARRERFTKLLARIPDDQRAAVVHALQTLAEATDDPS